ncbi:MAG: hypothetical protein K6F90_01750 [Lachnospiraceae bacterium]|nr:hypothetical protein [Lachnospiraceae bacterium]
MPGPENNDNEKIFVNTPSGNEPVNEVPEEIKDVFKAMDEEYKDYEPDIPYYGDDDDKTDKKEYNPFETDAREDDPFKSDDKEDEKRFVNGTPTGDETDVEMENPYASEAAMHGEAVEEEPVVNENEEKLKNLRFKNDPVELYDVGENSTESKFKRTKAMAVFLIESQDKLRKQIEQLRHTDLKSEENNIHVRDFVATSERYIKLDISSTPEQIKYGLDECNKALIRCMNSYENKEIDFMADARNPLFNSINKDLLDNNRRLLNTYEKMSDSEKISGIASNLNNLSITINEKASPESKLNMSKSAEYLAGNMEKLVEGIKKNQKEFKSLGKLIGSDSDYYKNMIAAVDKVAALDRNASAIEVCAAVNALKTYTESYLKKTKLKNGGNGFNGYNRKMEAKSILKKIEKSGFDTDFKRFDFNLAGSLKEEAKEAAKKSLESKGFVIKDKTDFDDLMKEEGGARPSKTTKSVRGSEKEKGNKFEK